MNAPLVIGCIAGPALTLLSLAVGLVFTTRRDFKQEIV